LSNFVFEDNERFDCTEWSEEFFNLSFGHLCWNVFEIKIVDQFSKVVSVIFWLKNERVWISVGGFLSVILVIKAYVSETFLGMIWVN